MAYRRRYVARPVVVTFGDGGVEHPEKEAAGSCRVVTLAPRRVSRVGSRNKILDLPSVRWLQAGEIGPGSTEVHTWGNE